MSDISSKLSDLATSYKNKGDMTNPSYDFKDQVALVTGASTGMINRHESFSESPWISD
jgi:3-oxoacyl-ACP reductase-like protein